jgi:phage-related minor tail protein
MSDVNEVQHKELSRRLEHMEGTVEGMRSSLEDFIVKQSDWRSDLTREFMDGVRNMERIVSQVGDQFKDSLSRITRVEKDQAKIDTLNIGGLRADLVHTDAKISGHIKRHEDVLDPRVDAVAIRRGNWALRVVYTLGVGAAGAVVIKIIEYATHISRMVLP